MFYTVPQVFWPVGWMLQIFHLFHHLSGEILDNTWANEELVYILIPVLTSLSGGIWLMFRSRCQNAWWWSQVW